MSGYNYVRRTYGVNPEVGQRVAHTVTKRFGTIVRERVGASAKNAVKTHCIHGHEFAGENLRIVTRSDGQERRCMICHRATKARARGK